MENKTPKTKTVVARASGATDIGQRKSNEDSYLIDEEQGLFIVADGMGGHDKGEVASWFTSEKLTAIVESLMPSKKVEVTIDHGKPPKFEELLEYAVLAINLKLHKQNEEVAKAEIDKATDKAGVEIAKIAAAKKRMGTTLVSLLIRGEKGYLTSIGDSRAYRIGGNSIHQLTRDHSWVAERVSEGELTPEEARTHKGKNIITRSVGIKPEAKADIDVLTLHPPEKFLLCSDGLSNVLTAAELLEFARMNDLKNACDGMVRRAKEKGGKDNITAVIVEVSMKSKSPLPKIRYCGSDDETVP